ncbi:unnamed protein product [Calypogeia fissa]
MAEVLEAMGFPSEWCERALKSASGLETAVDLLLQWQANGMPQYNLPSSVRPSSSPPRSPSSAVGKSVLQPTQPQQQQANSRLTSSGTLPILRLQPLPSASAPASASKAAVIDDEREQSPSSTLFPSTSSACPSSLEGPSGVNYPHDSESPSASFPRGDTGGSAGPSADNNNNNNPNPPGASRMAATGNSSMNFLVSHGTGRGGGGGGSGSSNRTTNTADSSDAVVPDAYAEERKARYAAARRAKQEKEEEKARIRQHMQEDMALRRFRNSYQSPLPESERNSASVAAVVSSPRAVSNDTAVELHIRCPGNQNLKASFTAGASLKDVRAYVDHELQQPLRVLGSQDHYSVVRPGSVPFSGQSARLSSDRQAERELLQAARENFEVQTSRILASAKSLRDVSGMSPSSSGGVIYFLIPFPRQEFFTESAMETTLAEAQLVPRGTLVVQYRQREMEVVNSVQVHSKNYSSDIGMANVSADNIHHVSRPGTAEVAVVEENVLSNCMEVDSENNQDVGVPNFETGKPCFDLSINETVQSRRTLEMEGERVRVRELALQAAAKRMSEAAKIFRAGLPLTEGETGEAFHFPRDGEHQDMESDALEKTPSPQEAAPGIASVPLPVDNGSIGLKTAGADAELLDASFPTDEHPVRRNGPDGWPLDRSRNALHRQAVAAAEGRMRNSQLPQPNMLGGVFREDPEEAESRIGENEMESLPMRGRARIPESSRLLSRPEKLQRTSDGSPHINSPAAVDVERQMSGGSSRQRECPLSIGDASRAGPLEAALQRCKAASEGDTKGKAIVEEQVAPPVAVPSSSIQVEVERNSSLRVRLEDGNVVLHTFPANTLLRAVRDSVVPEGAVASEYGFVVPFPEPHFVEGDALAATLEEVGLVPRGTIHLTKLATRGMVRQGRIASRRRRYLEDSDDEEDNLEGMIRHLAERMGDRPDLSYEELMELEESIGRVNVGVPEEVITTLPTHIVKAKKVETIAEDNAEGEPDLCIVCMAEMADGEEALSLPCFHTFHTVCIRQWLLQSTCCPTCKQALV